MMNKIALVLLVVVSICAISCKSNRNPEIILTDIEITHHDNLSSASGISLDSDGYYIIGDDTPWLYKVDNNLEIIDSIKVSKIDSSINNRIPKKLKADFECADIITVDNHTEIIIISSGSIKGSRDTSYIVRLGSSPSIISKNIRPMFEMIKEKANINSQNEINIEGIAISNDLVYLLHRGNVSENLIIRIGRNDFMNYLSGGIVVPDFDIFKFILPIYQGVSSGFSGACVAPDSSGLFFTASMEDTNDEVNDGAVLGSFIGFIPFSDFENSLFYSSLLMKDGVPLEKKLEGISVVSDQNSHLQLITVCDNDDGTSDIIKMKLEIK